MRTVLNRINAEFEAFQTKKATLATELKTVFGDHVEVTVNRNGTTSLMECSHD